MNFQEELERKKNQADEIIRRFLPAGDLFPKKLVDAMNYSMEAGGKRIRPILMMESYHLFGGDSAIIEPFMAAIEMIHTHSLVHDDLPAVDNDDLRRGKPTTHAVYGEALGILAGDALLNYAYETAIQAFFYTEDKRLVINALRVLARKSGVEGMIGGQSIDVENEKAGNPAMDVETLDYIYLHKTAALLEAPLMIGAILAGAEKGEIDCMEQIGRMSGLAFQIQDDILDVTSTAEELGKPIGSDKKNEKTTYVTLLGVNGAAQKVEQLTDEAVRLLDTMSGDSEFLRELVHSMASRRR